MAELMVMKGGKKAKSRVLTTGIRQDNFGLFGDQLVWISGDTVLTREVQDSWLFFRDYLPQAQEWSILTSKKSNKGGKMPAWVNRVLLTGAGQEKEASRWWKQGQVIEEEQRHIDQVHRDGVRKAKAHLKLHSVRGAESNKMGFFRAFGIRRCWESWDYPTQKEKVRGTLSTYMNTDKGSREDKPG